MTKTLPRLAAIAVLLLPTMAPLACEVPATSTLSPADTERIAGFEQSRSRGLAEALMGESAAERRTVSTLFAGGTEPIDAIADGAYRCRTIKLGGLLPLIVYGAFDCTIADGGTTIEKTSGSQRFTGTLAPSDGALFYQGALHYNDDPARTYGEEPDFDQVGCLYRVEGQDLYRLEMPSPRFESTHDVIELVPAP